MHNCKRITIFVEQFKTHIMIYTTDFLNALRHFESVAKKTYLTIEMKIEAKKDLLNELEKLKGEINEVDLGEETPELFEGTNNALNNL